MQGALRSAFLAKSGLSKEQFVATGAMIAFLIDISRLLVYVPAFVAARASARLPDSCRGSFRCSDRCAGRKSIFEERNDEGNTKHGGNHAVRGGARAYFRGSVVERSQLVDELRSPSAGYSQKGTAIPVPAPRAVMGAPPHPRAVPAPARRGQSTTHSRRVPRASLDPCQKAGPRCFYDSSVYSFIRAGTELQERDMTTIGELCMRDVVVGTSEMTVAAAAKIMRQSMSAAW